MDRRQLQTAEETLSLSTTDLHTISRERKRERWLYPITGAIASASAALLGWFMGREDEQSSGSGYPYYTTHIGLSSVALEMSIISTLVISTVYVMKQRRWELRPEQKRGFFIGALISLVFVIFTLTYRLSQPEKYYSVALDYGVYSQETVSREECVSTDPYWRGHCG